MLQLFDQNDTKTVILLNIIILYSVFYLNIFLKYWYEFSAASSVLHDSSEIILISWLGAQEPFLFISNVENSCASQPS